MIRSTKIALKASIEKWKKNTLITNIKDAKTRPSDCPLCDMFLNYMGHRSEGDPNPCEGCPVFEKTGKRFCHDTPYVEADIAYRETQNLADFILHAKEEVKFLENLLPKKYNFMY